MPDFILARVIHVLAVVLWIGGVGMVTTVLLPEIRRSYPAAERFGVFHGLEKRFAGQSRVTTALAGASGFYMVWRLDAWDRFESWLGVRPRRRNAPTVWWNGCTGHFWR
jgi:uncharacterized membrane protein